MTSLAFILGVVPLALAVGAGAEMRSTLGIAVFSGMLGVTLFGIFLTPVFYYVVVKLTGTPCGDSGGRTRPNPRGRCARSSIAAARPFEKSQNSASGG